MECKHERLQCVNNVFFCLDCGARVERDTKPVQEEKTQEGPKKAKKTAAKKGDK